MTHLTYFIDPSPPMILGEDYDLLSSKIGTKVWTDNDDKFTSLPDFLNGAYYFQTSVKGNKGKSWSLKVYGPSAIYIAIHDEVDITIEKLEGGGGNMDSKPTNPTDELDDEDNGDNVSRDKRSDEVTGGLPEENNEGNTGDGPNKWRKLSGAVTTSALTLSQILAKNLHNKGLNTIELPEIQTENLTVSIFITGKIYMF
jgi:hypothetical protein